MKLSIITVNLNNREGLRKTIDSVVGQTFRDFEWIVIDGGSTDGSRELIEQYADHIAYWVSEPDKGIYNAMNKGIRVAQGEYLQFLNSGDWLVEERTLERCFAHEFTADIAYGDLYIANHEDIEELRYTEELSLRYFLHGTICHNSTFIKRYLLVEEPYDENLRIVADWKSFLLQVIENRRFEHIDEFIIYYDANGISTNEYELSRQERQSISKDIVPAMILQDYRQMDEMEAVLESNQVKKVLAYGQKRRLYHQMITGCLMLIGFIDHFVRKGKE